VVWAGYATHLASAVSVAVAAVAAIRDFWHRGGAPHPGEVREASLPMVAAPLVASGLGIVLGLAPALTDALVSASSRAMGSEGDLLALRSGADDGSGGIATAAVLAVGAAIFLVWDRLHRLFERLSWVDAFGPLALYESASRWLPALGAWVTNRLQSGSLTAYLSMSMGFSMLALAASWAAAWPMPLPSWSMPSWPALGAVAAIVAAAISVCVVRDPFVMLLASGLGGLGSALLFLFLGAPDLALTQIAVEVAFVVVVAAVILRVRRLDLPPVVPTPRLPRALLALAAGGIVAGLTLAASTPPHDPALPRYFIERSVPEAHGRNVVNVIIVDFRAADTLGEITVVTMSFLAELPLLRLLKARGAGAGESR
jgi:multicomponent Na+:H+ antiporter subunit A